jgi:hypothetical protein
VTAARPGSCGMEQLQLAVVYAPCNYLPDPVCLGGWPAHRLRLLSHAYITLPVSRLCCVPVAMQGRMPADLIRALRSTFLCDPMSAHNPSICPEDFDWAGLGAAVSSMHRTVPGVSCLLGPLEAQVSSTGLPAQGQGQQQLLLLLDVLAPARWLVALIANT